MELNLEEKMDFHDFFDRVNLLQYDYESGFDKKYLDEKLTKLSLDWLVNNGE